MYFGSFGVIMYFIFFQYDNYSRVDLSFFIFGILRKEVITWGQMGDGGYFYKVVLKKKGKYKY